MWVAKISDKLGVLFDYDLSPKFRSIYDCQEYIDNNLKELEGKLCSIVNECDFKVGKLVFRFGSFIRCYNIEQKRFADSFDF